MLDEIKVQLQQQIDAERSRKRRNSLVRTIVVTAFICVILLQVVFGVAKVEGNSMEPVIQNGNKVIFYRLDRSYGEGDVVIADTPAGEVVKRIKRTENGEIYLMGDNLSQSIDSRQFGTIDEDDVIGKVIYVLDL